MGYFDCNYNNNVDLKLNTGSCQQQKTIVTPHTANVS